MGIGSITSSNSMSGLQMVKAGSTDTKSKKIQNEITSVQQQIQKVSSKEDLSVSEKVNERKKLQREISSLNTELKQHQEELGKSKKKEIRLAELQENNNLTKEEKSENQNQTKETSAAQAGEKDMTASEKQAGQQGTVISSSSDGIVILKGNESQDDEAKEESIAEKEEKTTDNDNNTDTSLSRKETHAIISSNASVQQANRQGTVIAQTRDGIAVLKGEINQDEKLGIDTEKKQAELEKMEKKEQRAVTFQFSILGEANKTMKSAAEANSSAAKAMTPISAGNNAFINALKILQEDQQASQQRFNVSFG